MALHTESNVANSPMPHRRLGMYTVLLDAARHDPLGVWLARILSSWLAGDTALPANLGLGEQALAALMRHHFPGITLPEHLRWRCAAPDPGRDLEREALIELFRQHCQLSSPDADWLARILAEGCLGEDHLWQDLGLWARGDVSALLVYGFSPLAARNVRDMKWKKFFYKQLCEAANVQLCRAPSCDACQDYANCFGPEEG
ncbi:MAG: nitrogen fixation protein NifQ [Magnetococcales bacterium]|nr:nitrogen fixation protein NifQ [Magnetococcales bacterium]